MISEFVKEALRQLERILEDYKHEKSGEFVLELLVQFYLGQTLPLRAAIDLALIEWLKSGDLIRADYAIALSSRLGITENLSALRAELQAVRNRTSRLPGYFVEFLEPAVNTLEAMEGGSGR